MLDGLRIHGLLPDSPVARSPAATFETARGILARAMPFLTAAVSYLRPAERPGRRPGARSPAPGPTVSTLGRVAGGRSEWEQPGGACRGFSPLAGIWWVKGY